MGENSCIPMLRALCARRGGRKVRGGGGDQSGRWGR